MSADADDRLALASLTMPQYDAIKRASCPYCAARLPVISHSTANGLDDWHHIPGADKRFQCEAQRFIKARYSALPKT